MTFLEIVLFRRLARLNWALPRLKWMDQRRVRFGSKVENVNKVL